MLDEIKRNYPEYFENSDNLCFNTCHYNGYDYIIVLSKLSDTKTNECRTDIVNPLYATFRGDKFIVIKIISKTDPLKTINEVQKSYDGNTLTYKTGKEVSVNDFDDNLEEVYSTGINYVKSVEAAFYNGLAPSNYSGKWYYYHANGNKHEEGYFLNGRENGKWNYYYDNENKKAEGYFLNGLEDGKWNYYYDNGKIREKGYYFHGMMHGKWIEYYENGNKKRKVEYRCDEETGIWTLYYENGNKKVKGKKFNYARTGKWIYYYENGNKKMEGIISNGDRTGRWIYYYENGKIKEKGEFLNRDIRLLK